MAPTMIEQMAQFAADADINDLPSEVVQESKRILLDSLGCALGSSGEQFAEVGVQYGRLVGGPTGPASIIGTPHQTSEVGAAFANAELINALDHDAILPPGHVTPYVLPGALAAAEAAGASGADLLAAIAVAHEVSYRMGKATDYLRNIKDGAVEIPPIVGYSSTVFGATAAIGVVRGLPADLISSGLGLAGSSSPSNGQRSWIAHSPPTTIKYQSAGGLAMAAMTASYLGEMGHRGDRQILDDREFGWPRFIGTERWDPHHVTTELGTSWTFPAAQSYKLYPHCRILHAPLDAVGDLVAQHDLAPEEIDSIRAWGESWVFEPLWVNEDIQAVRDAQFSMTHGLALGAHRVPVGKQWQDPDVVFNPSVLALMQRVTYEAHPDYAAAFGANPLARPTRVEISARGTTFVDERDFPRGSPSVDPSTRVTDDELAAKFRTNATGVIAPSVADVVVAAVLDLEHLGDVRTLMALLRQPPR